MPFSERSSEGSLIFDECKYAHLTVTFGPSDPPAKVKTYAYDDIKNGGNHNPTGKEVMIGDKNDRRRIMRSLIDRKGALETIKKTPFDVAGTLTVFHEDDAPTVMDMVFQTLRLLKDGHEVAESFDQVKDCVDPNVIKESWELVVPRVQRNETKGRPGKFPKELQELDAKRFKNIMRLLEVATKSSVVRQGSELDLGAEINSLHRLSASTGTTEPFFSKDLRESLPDAFKQLARRLDPDTYQYSSEMFKVRRSASSRPEEAIKLIVQVILQIYNKLDALGINPKLTGGNSSTRPDTRLHKAEELLSLVSDTLVDHVQKALLCVNFVEQLAGYANVTTAIGAAKQGQSHSISQYEPKDVAIGSDGNPSHLPWTLTYSPQHSFGLAVTDGTNLNGPIDLDAQASYELNAVVAGNAATKTAPLTFMNFFFQLLTAVRAGHVSDGQIDTNQHADVEIMRALWNKMVPTSTQHYSGNSILQLNSEVLKNLLRLLGLAIRAETSIQGRENTVQEIQDMKEELINLCKNSTQEPFTEAYQILKYVAPGNLRRATRGLERP